MQRVVYYLTGMGGRLNAGLGQALLRRGLLVNGRELVGEFSKLEFQQKIDLIAEDLQTKFWHKDARVIANSFGAYLFLHAQAQLQRYVGKVLLLSPIVGEFANKEMMMGFIPPRSQRLAELIRGGKFNSPVHCEMHVGSKDWQSNPNAVRQVGEAMGAAVHILEDAGHSLPKSYVNNTLDNWLLEEKFLVHHRQ